CYLLAGALLGRMPALARWRTPARRGDRRRLWLSQAGLHVTPIQFDACSAALGAVALAVGWATTRIVLLALVPAALAACAPRVYFGRRRAARLREVHDAWPDGLRDIVASIGAGRSLTQAVNDVSTSGPASLREAFARFPSLARMLGTGAALEVVKGELA